MVRTSGVKKASKFEGENVELTPSAGPAIKISGPIAGFVDLERTDADVYWSIQVLYSKELAIKDATNNTFPFKIKAGAPDDSILIESDGTISLRTGKLKNSSATGYIELTTNNEIMFSDLKARGQITTASAVYDQAIFWLAAIGYGIEDLALATNNIARLTSGNFADLALKCRLYADDDYIFGRHQDHNNWYGVWMEADASSSDHRIRKCVGGSISDLATESVDLSKAWYWVKFEVVGSTLNSYRASSPTSDVPDTPTLTATDTDISTGRWGVRHFGHGAYGLTGLFFFFEAPSSNAPKPLALYEVEVIGEGTEEDPFRPKMPEEIVTIEKKEILDPIRYKKLKKALSGVFTEEQINALAEALGFIRTKETINKLAATWSAVIPTPKGELADSVCIVRIFDVKSTKVVDKLREMGAKKISDHKEAIKKAMKLDDRFHIADFIQAKGMRGYKLSKEYRQWREETLGVKFVRPYFAYRYVKMYKGWTK